jgi:hypothetical protein
MGDCFLKGRAAQRLLARFSPPFDREVVQPGLGEVMCDGLGFGRCALGIVDEVFCRALMQRLATTFQQTLVRGVLD